MDGIIFAISFMAVLLTLAVIANMGPTTDKSKGMGPQ